MVTSDNIVDTLEDTEVKNYFLNILDRDIPSIEKYNKFIEFFKYKSSIKNRVMNYTMHQIPTDRDQIDKIVSKVSREMGYWSPQKTQEKTADAIKRAIRRLKKSQHCDGGWGPYAEISNFWYTCYAVLCLLSAKKSEDISFDVDTDEMLMKGIDWLLKNSREWSVECIPPISGISLYHVSLAVRCFSQSRDKYPVVDNATQHIIQSQNEDGGWDASIWGAEIRTPIKVYSEVGAASMALQALAEIKPKGCQNSVRKAIHWLFETQNEDGSWNNGSCSPDRKPLQLGGKPVINKTCDALQGILVGDTFGIKREPFEEERIARAVRWLQNREKPILDEDRKIKGWGWDYSIHDFENTCLTLETLVKMPDASLTLLTSNASWLMKNQHKEEGSDEDGNWKYGHTARITLSLIEYYKKIKESSLFMVGS